jgi:hypothetical protein
MGLTVKGINHSFECRRSQLYVIRKIIADSISEELGNAFEQAMKSLLFALPDCSTKLETYTKIYELMCLPMDIHYFLWGSEDREILSWKVADFIIPYMEKLPDNRKRLEISYVYAATDVGTFI